MHAGRGLRMPSRCKVDCLLKWDDLANFEDAIGDRKRREWMKGSITRIRTYSRSESLTFPEIGLASISARGITRVGRFGQKFSGSIAYADQGPLAERIRRRRIGINIALTDWFSTANLSVSALSVSTL